jgi:hypothetical protein
MFLYCRSQKCDSTDQAAATLAALVGGSADALEQHACPHQTTTEHSQFFSFVTEVRECDRTDQAAAALAALGGGSADALDEHAGILNYN